MLFNSLDFAIFVCIVFSFYWLLNTKKLRYQNLLILLSSYVFYAWWDWRFLFLIIFSTTVDYLVGIYLGREKNKSTRKALLWISVLVNLGFLGFFKYFNFFLESFISTFTFFGFNINASSLNIILPVGISFYTFQTLSYTIDIYKNKLKPTTNFIAFSAFVSFFPQLVAGPIERASDLLSQFLKKRQFEYSKAVDGTRQILWGLFKKVVIADNCAQLANDIFANSDTSNGATLLLGALFFTFQIYGDFSGYSDMAIGTARLFGFNLSQNFSYPFFSRSVPEFWTRWHITLTKWFRDYLFVPLVRRFPVNIFTKVLNVFILFIVIGLWHGANWNFFLWGIYLALFYLPSLYIRRKKETAVVAEGKYLPSPRELYEVLITFTKFVFGAILFRAESVAQILVFYEEIFSLSLFEIPMLKSNTLAGKTTLLIVVFVIIEWLGREDKYAIEKLPLKFKSYLRYLIYYLIVFSIFWFAGKEQDFIYFQF